MQTGSKRFFLDIAYDGTAYHGWQLQDNAVTVQEKLNQALETVLRKEVDTVGAGRTDTGVHAKQLFVHFDHAEPIGDHHRIVHALNALCPSDIAVKRLFEVAPDAHARFDATQRAYEYHVHFEKNPFLNRYSWQLRDFPDVDKMNQAGRLLLGQQDFSCFSKAHTQVFTNICTITEAMWKAQGDKMVFHIRADRFLRNMVRAIVGTMMEIGIKGKPVHHMRDVIASKDRSQAGASVPACGLYLSKVEYPYIAQKP